MRDEPRVHARPSLWIVLFLSAVLMPLMDTLLGFDPAPARDENRRLAKRPHLIGGGPLSDFPSRFENYYRDHFGLRNTLLDWHCRLKMDVFGISPVSKAVIGRDGWLYLTDNFALDYQRAGPMPPKKLANWTRLLEERRRWLETRGIHFLMVLVPNKHTIYPEYLPSTARAVWETSPADQLLARLRRDTAVEVLDLRPVLHQAKTRERVYFKHDTHWNDYGSYLGYRAIVERLGEKLEGLEPWAPDDYAWKRRRVASGDLARLMRLDGEVEETALFLGRGSRRRRARGPLEVEAPVSSRAYETAGEPFRALLVGDSFGRRLLKRLAEYFARLVYLKTFHVPREVVEREHPDVVVLELVERFLVVPGMPAHLLQVAHREGLRPE